MPLYEYECRSCGKRIEVLQRFEEAPLTVCPTCGGDLKKLFSAPAVQFKGTGWYVTDYGGKGASGADGKGSGKTEAKAEGAADSGKTEKKETPAPAAKSETKSAGKAAAD
jgi:putative FmdB family regulatory protein